MTQQEIAEQLETLEDKIARQRAEVARQRAELVKMQATLDELRKLVVGAKKGSDTKPPSGKSPTK
jgi:uncharacterized coiled-coil protein SlyX